MPWRTPAFRAGWLPGILRRARIFPSAIVDAVKSAHAFVLILTEHAAASPHVLTEVGHAFNGKKRIVPFRSSAANVARGSGIFSFLDAVARRSGRLHRSELEETHRRDSGCADGRTGRAPTVAGQESCEMGGGFGPGSGVGRWRDSLLAITEAAQAQPPLVNANRCDGLSSWHGPRRNALENLVKSRG